MRRLQTSEIINLIAAIEDSSLLRWKRQSNPDVLVQVLREFQLSDVQNRQGALQVIYFLLENADRADEFMAMGNIEDEPQE
jgi:hypothetical protein